MTQTYNILKYATISALSTYIALTLLVVVTVPFSQPLVAYTIGFYGLVAAVTSVYSTYQLAISLKLPKRFSKIMALPAVLLGSIILYPIIFFVRALKGKWFPKQNDIKKPSLRMKHTESELDESLKNNKTS